MAASGGEDDPVADSLAKLQQLVSRHALAVTELAAELTSAHADIVRTAAAGVPLVPPTGTGGTTRNERFGQAAHSGSVKAGEKCAPDPAPTKAGSKDSGRSNHVGDALMAAVFHHPDVPDGAAECEDDVGNPLKATGEPVQKYGANASHSKKVQDILADPPGATGDPAQKYSVHEARPERSRSSSSAVHWSNLRTSVRMSGRMRAPAAGPSEVRREEAFGNIFADPEALKEAIRESLTEDPLDLASFYHRTGCSQAVARSHAFEMVSLAMVCLSSLWMGVEVEFNDSVGLFGAHPIFQVMAQVFCVFFVAELAVRFLAFRNKADVNRDTWFLFDAVIVAVVVFETWVVSTAVALMDVDGSATAGGGKLRILAVFRTVRVLRVLRLARILRRLPELMIIVRGIAIALRGIGTIIGLLTFVIYLGAIVFRVLLDGTGVGQDHFSSIPSAMGTLLLELTLSGGRGTTIIRQAYGDNLAYSFCLLVFVIFSNVTVMGVLSGLLVQTVKAVAEIEWEEKNVRGMQSTMNRLWDLIIAHDTNHDEMISMPEFQAILLDRDIARVLQRMGVDLDGLGNIAHFVFEENEGALTKGQFKRMVLDLRNNKAAKVKDHVETRKFISAQFKKNRSSMHHSATVGAVPGRADGAAASVVRDQGKTQCWR